MLIRSQAHNCGSLIGFVGIFQDPHTEARMTIVLERARGGDLSDFVKRVGCLNERSVWEISTGIMRALSHLHNLETPIIHRDIKIENVLLTASCEAKIADFGLACEVTDDVETSRPCGSPGYMAPEILTRCRYGCKVDVFGAGVILHLLLVGKLPFAGSDTTSTLRRNARCRLDFEDSRWSRVSHDATSAVKALMACNPDHRTSSAESLTHPWYTTSPQ